MEDHRILRWRNWPVVRKAQVIGAVAGASVTIAAPIIGVLAESQAEPHRQLFDLPMLLMGLVMYPTWIVGRALGLHLYLTTGTEGLSLAILALAVIINAVLFFVLGTAVGWLLKQRQPRSTETET